MMKTIYKQLFTLVAALLLSISVPAQNLPALPGDPAVKQGVLPNGMKYYLSSNPSSKGRADFALVQKTGLYTVSDTSAPEVLELARRALSYVPRLENRSPQEFMTSHGAAAGSRGFAEVRDDATVFRFPGLRLTDGKTVLDSALLVVMDMTERVSWSDDEFMKKWYAPSDQAIIVSGDIDVNSTAEKLRMLSYMTPKRESAARKEYVWTSREEPVFVASDVMRDGLTAVSMTWRSARQPRSFMNTVQTATFAMSMDILGDIARGRIHKILRDRDIPVADIACMYMPAHETPYDETFTVSVYVDPEDADDALLAVAEVMASLDGAGASVNEFRASRAKFIDELHESAVYPVRDNGEYVDRCISAFLYDSSLASDAEVLKYHRSRNLPDTTGTRLFNDIIAALLDGSKELKVSCADPSDASFRSRLDSVWTANEAAGVVKSAAPNLRDTVSFPGIGPKMRIKSVKKDHLSGGSIWTFSNGFKVVYRNMPSSDKLYYTLALNGGYGTIPDLSEGEGAFLSDYPDLCFIAGLKAVDFKSILASAGITMDTQVTLSNTMVNGYAPEGRVRFLLKSLLALVSDRRPDEAAFRYYMECNDLMLKHQEGSYVSRMTAIDSIMCPGYAYSAFKAPGKLTPAFAAKAEKFFSEQSGKMNDGVLVIVGDIAEDVLKKALLEYVGAFSTSSTAYRRPVVKYQPVSGWSTYTVDGYDNSVDIAMSARMPLTAGNYAAAAVAAKMLEQRIVEHMSEAGMYVSVSQNCRIYPEERVNLSVSVMNVVSSIDALSMLRSVLSGMSSAALDEGHLAACKAALKNEVSLEMKSPLYWTNAIALRYLDGKDLTTGYAGHIDAVKAADVRNVLEMLENGSKVEYVITKK